MQTIEPSRTTLAAAASMVLAATLVFGCRGMLGVRGGTTRSDAGGSGGNPSVVGSGGATSAAGAANNPSCKGLNATCGPTESSDCCASTVIPGGDFHRSYDGKTFSDARYPASVSAFALDTYEVTVGRFQKFIAAYSRDIIAEAAGKNPNDPNDPGWNIAWNANLPTDAAALACAVFATSPGPGVPPGGPLPWNGAGAGPGISDATAPPSAPCEPGTPGPESSPMTGINWYLAFAFCIWDEGRLPTEAEWNYAAAGGDEQRAYPWGGEAPDRTRAVASLPNRSTPQAPERVGSKSPDGDGKWGHSDLAGNVAEWNLDWYWSPYEQAECVDCASTTKGSTAQNPGLLDPPRVVRGGSYNDDTSTLLTSYRAVSWCPEPGCSSVLIGVRCARKAP